MLASLSLSACREPPPPQTLEVEYAGCAEVRLPGPVCIRLQDKPLRVWVRAEPGQTIEVEFAGRASRETGVEVGGGLRLELDLPPEAGELSLAVAEARRGARRSWRLRLEVERGRPSRLALDALPAGATAADKEAHLAGRWAEAPAADRGDLACELGVFALRRGDLATSRAWFAKAVTAFRAAGQVAGEVRATTLAARAAMQAYEFGAARRALEELVVPPGASGHARFVVDFNRAQLARRVGDLRGALASLGEAESRAERLGLARDWWVTLQERGLVLRFLGRAEEARALFQRLRAERPQEVVGEEWAQFLNNQAWDLVLAKEAGEEVEDASPILEQARKVFDGVDEAADRWQARLSVRLNLALAAWQRGDLAAVRRALAEAAELAGGREVFPRERSWWLDLEARLALAEGRAGRARQIYGQLAAEPGSAEAAWRAAVGLGQAALALGRFDDALAAYQRAEEQVEAETRAVPVHEGRESFASLREAGARAYVDLLLRLERPERALAVARRARSRILRQLALRERWQELGPAERQQLEPKLAEVQRLMHAAERTTREVWRLPAAAQRRAWREREALRQQALAELDRTYGALVGAAAELPRFEPELRPDELTLCYFPLAGRRWVVFAATAGRVEAHQLELPRLPAGSAAELAAALLEPVAAPLERARRIRVLAYGALRQVDFHALPWRGGVLLEQAPVAYGLDLARLAASAGEREAAATLLVGDPRGDLPAARREIDLVAQALATGPVTGPVAGPVASLSGERATAAELRQRLPEVGLFHFAGHGSFGGVGGWGSELLLAEGSRLAVGEVLALARVPPRVVLSACDVGRSSEAGAVEGLGLAQALVIAGAREVIASRRPVADEATAELLPELYRHWAPGADAASALRLAQLAARRRAPAADWASFRVYEP